MKNAWGDEAEEVRKVWRSILFIAALAFYLGFQLCNTLAAVRR